jgi:hypothetical protein
MGGKPSVKIANSTYNDMWVSVDSERQYITEVDVKARAEYNAFKASGSVSMKYEWTKQVSGYTRIASENFFTFDVPHEKYECYVTAFDEKGNFFGGPQCFRAVNGTYFNIVMCDDHCMRRGFKNKIFRCAEGMQEYYGPFVCPGCKTKKCQDPRRSGSDGWCGKLGK